MIGNKLIQNLAKPFQHQVNTYGAFTKFLTTVKAAASDVGRAGIPEQGNISILCSK